MDDLDLAKLKEEQGAADNKKLGLNLIGSIGDALSNRQSFGNFYSGKMNPKNDMASKTAGALAESVEDPIARQQKAMEYIKSKRAMTADAANSDPNSTISKSKKMLATKYGFNLPPEASGADVDQLMDARKMNETSARAAIDFNNDMAKLRFSKQADLEKFRAEQGIKKAEKAEQAAKLDDKQVGAVTDLDNAEGDLRNLISMLGEKSNWTGPVDGRVPDMMVGDDQVAWRSALGKYKDAYRKAVTGAGASNAEIARLEGRLPSETDTYANFNAKANEALKEIARRKETLLGNYSKMGKNIAQYSSKPPPAFVQMRAPDGSIRNVPEDQVDDALASGGQRISAGNTAGR